MKRYELAELMARLGGSRLAPLVDRLLDPEVPAAFLAAWDCPRCGRVDWEAGATARCRRCGFWDTPT